MTTNQLNFQNASWNPKINTASLVDTSYNNFASNPPPTAATRWTEPFEAVVFNGNKDHGEAIKGVITAASETSQHVQKGFYAAQNWLPSCTQTLRGYFAVSHSSVGRKLASLFFPPLGYRYLWKLREGSGLRKQSSSIAARRSVIEDDMNTKQSKHIYDIHHTGPDLYLPIMAFTSYVLLYGLTKGTFDNFHPEVLSTTSSYGVGILTVESLLVAAVFYTMGAGYLPFLDLVSILSLKFQSLVSILITGIFVSNNRSIIFWSVFIYCSLCAVHATFQTLQECEFNYRPESEWGSYKTVPHGFLYACIVISLLQIPLCWILTPSFVSKTFYLTIFNKTVVN